MKKIRSTELFNYLNNKGVLGRSETEIALAKKEYIKKYKRDWKRNRLKKKPEIRPNFTPKEYELITNASKARGLTKPDFLRQCGLTVASQTDIISNKDKLLVILQKLSIAGIKVSNKKSSPFYDSEIKDADNLLQECERLLMIYLGYDS